MRKLLLAAIAAATFVPAGVSAQSAHEIRHDQRQIDKDLANGRYHKAARDQRELDQDWRAYRRTHRHVYDRPDYIWPSGYSYNTLSIGSTLDQVFWGPRYRVSNYSTYRLPYPGYNREWVRYGNDVALINTRNGRVITVYNNFFY